MNLGDDIDFADARLKYVEQMLAGEDDNERFQWCNPMALQAMEKSFYQVLNDRNGSPTDYYTYGSSSSSSADQFNLGTNSFNLGTNSLDNTSLLNKSEWVRQFTRGAEEATKFLPPQGLAVTTDTFTKHNNENRIYSGGSQDTGERSRNSDERPDDGHQDPVDELSEMFDRLFLIPGKEAANESQLPKAGKSVKRGRGRKRRIRKPVVDLERLIMDCARRIACNDNKAADELLREIREHSSPLGDGSERLAHYFADALEARLAGTGPQLYAASYSNPSPSSNDILRAHRSFTTICPFRQIGSYIVDHYILKLAQKASTLHIIDFGIQTGFQWARTIQLLSSAMPDGPPKLRITGLEHSDLVFGPGESIVKTGCRLAKYCKRFHVAFEYKGIDKRWETLRAEDLGIEPNEAVYVISRFQLEKLLDEVDGVDSPRTAVLDLIREINPDIFVHFVVNGAYNMPSFFPRVRQAFFHFTKYFDILETSFPRESEDRLIFEKPLFWREVLNIVACEGSERVERAETYREWQVRTERAGFRPLSLERELVKELEEKVKTGYHKDYRIEEDGHWILQGWKGRTLCAIGCWVRAPH